MIKSLMLYNAGPYRGEHVVELRSMVYAITARFESDPGRSNTGGKSFLLEMIRFALTGQLAKFRRYDADGWITRGEREGRVRLELEDGYWISRERKRGQPTQVKFGGPGVELGKGAAQADAAEKVLKHLCFDEEDFCNVAYFEQKQMARLVLTQPEERMEIVRGWLGLGKADLAEDRLGSLAAGSASELERLRALREALITTMGDKPAPFDFDAAEAKKRELDAQHKEVNDTWRRCTDDMGTLRENKKIVSDYDELVIAGKSLADEVSKIEIEELREVADAAAKTLDEKQAVLTAAKNEVRAKHKVSLGQFDGRCPVASIECPATKQINADRGASKAAYDQARRVEQVAFEEHAAASSAHVTAFRAYQSAKTNHDTLAEMRKKAIALQEKVTAAKAWLEGYVPPDYGALDERRRELQKQIGDVHSEIVTARAALDLWDKQCEKLHVLEQAINCEQREFSIASRGRSVFRAVQRRVAERALSSINRQASAMLADGNIPLSVELRWEREGKDPAKHCEDCGAAFPKSAKIKECTRCGAARGLQIVQKLEFLPSDRSGAADDIAGVVLQLAAGAWFLRSKKSPWATAMLDEPLGACDRTNRRALSMQLVKLLSTGVWRQALLISHSPDTIELYPGRIEIVIGRDGSRRIVQT